MLLFVQRAKFAKRIMTYNRNIIFDLEPDPLEIEVRLVCGGLLAAFLMYEP